MPATARMLGTGRSPGVHKLHAMEGPCGIIKVGHIGGGGDPPNTTQYIGLGPPNKTPNMSPMLL